MPYCSEPIGAIVGGAIGGLVVIMAIILLLLYFRGRRPMSIDRVVPRGMEIDPDPRHDVKPVSPRVQRNGHAPAGGSQLFQSTTPPNLSAIHTPENPYEPTSAWLAAQYAYTQSALYSHNSPISSPSVPSITALDPSDRISVLSSAAEPSEARFLSPASTRPTGDQLEFVRNPHSPDVPVVEISSILERMRAERAAVGFDETTNLGQNNVMASGVTIPRYDSI